MILIIVAAYTALLVQDGSGAMKALGYEQLMDLYAKAVSSRSPVHIVYDPGIRELPVTTRQVVEVVLPGTSRDFARQLDGIMEKRPAAVVECSALDGWHCTREGQTALFELRQNAYRVVVFDGGHHLPTLGLAPDLIIIPSAHGYAVHSYMVDAIKVNDVVRLVKESHCPVAVVAVPRWMLIKNEKALAGVTTRALQQLSTRAETAPPCYPRANVRMSRYNNTVFAYINREYLNRPELFWSRLEELGPGIDKVYLAFDYEAAGVMAASDFTQQAARHLKVRVERVNYPLNAFNVFWGD